MAKFEQHKPEGFIPVQITLETQNEVDAIASLLGATNDDFDEIFGVGEQLTNLFRALDKIASPDRHQVEVSNFQT